MSEHATDNMAEKSEPALQGAAAKPAQVEASGRLKTQNLYNRMEWAGALGDIGTLIPFVVAYITIVHVEPLGLLFMFGVCEIAAGLYYRTPMPIQPMKAIGAAAIAGAVSPAQIFAAGITTALFWLAAGVTGSIQWVAKLATRPVVRGIMLGLGFSFLVNGVHRMTTAPLLAVIAMVLAFLLLNNRKIPAMFALLVLGAIAAVVMNPQYLTELGKIRPGFRLPAFGLHGITWNDVLIGTWLFTLPQIPLTLGNAVIAVVAENNELFPDRPVSEKKIAVSQGIMNLVAPWFGGVPMCHGAGGMAAHVRFGARTGGAPVILGCLVIGAALFLSDSISLLFRIFPDAVLGVILFFAGGELALVVRDIGDKKTDFYVMLVVAGFAMWNMGAAFVIGIVLDNALRRGWIRL